MQYLNLSLPTPEANLALDEALLELCEEGLAQSTLRIWESQIDFVVLGYSSKISEEVHLDLCQKDSISILRRPSGGCTVLQGPGCLNYSLILPLKEEERFEISSDNHWIMQKNRYALQHLTEDKVDVRGVSDLAISNVKFSGNAQRRLKKFMLFHGTVLYSYQLNKISKYLKDPKKQPEYREKRIHQDFIQNFPAGHDDIAQALREVWEATEDFAFDDTLEQKKEALIRQKYSQDTWNKKFL